MSPEDQSGFVRFAWGRSRLPPKTYWRVNMKILRRNTGEDSLPVSQSTLHLAAKCASNKRPDPSTVHIKTSCRWGSSWTVVFAFPSRLPHYRDSQKMKKDGIIDESLSWEPTRDACSKFYDRATRLCIPLHCTAAACLSGISKDGANCFGFPIFRDVLVGWGLVVMGLV